MGLRAIVARVLSYTRTVKNGAKISEVKSGIGGGQDITCEEFTSSGDDSQPLNTDYEVIVPLEREGVFVNVGYLDPKNEGKSESGEKRIYGRKSDGTVANQVWLKKDGSILVSNDLGSIEIKGDGEVSAVNPGGNLTLKPSGELESTVGTKISLTAPLFELNGAVQISGALAIGGGLSTLGGGSVAITGGIANTGGQLSSNGKILETHTHNITSGSSAPGPTAGPN